MRKNTIVELSFLKRAKNAELDSGELELLAAWLAQSQAIREFYAEFSRFDTSSCDYESSIDLDKEREFFVSRMRKFDQHLTVTYNSFTTVG